MNFFIENPNFDIKQTFLCGQCFRWTECENGDFEGIAGGRYLKARQSDKGVELLNIDENDIPFWENYFDMSTDYAAVIKQLSADKILCEAAKNASGIRILRQEPFETLISFIISQNNNIPRITGIISRLCESFGKPMSNGYSFPDAETLAALDENSLAPLRAGFRARYIIDGARKVADGSVDFAAIDKMDYESGKAALKQIVGVGDKVADCVLLFAFHKLDAFPKDVWIKRILAEFYPDGLPGCIGAYGGIAQQYLFDYARRSGKFEKK